MYSVAKESKTTKKPSEHFLHFIKSFSYLKPSGPCRLVYLHLSLRPLCAADTVAFTQVLELASSFIPQVLARKCPSPWGRGGSPARVLPLVIHPPVLPRKRVFVSHVPHPQRPEAPGGQIPPLSAQCASYRH